MNKIIKHIKIALLFGVIIFIVMKAIALILGNTVVFNSELLISFLFYMLYALVLYGVNAFLFIWLDTKFGRSNFPRKRIYSSVAGSLVLTMFAIFLLRIIEEVAVDGVSLLEFFDTEKVSYYVIPFIIAVIGILFFNAFYFYKALQDKKIKEQKIIAGTANAKYESLKSQLDPHFLFNSLNVLTSLIEEDQDKAQKFTTSLSKVYRYVLEQKDKDLVSLEEELQFAKTYILLLKMRFEDAIDCNIPEDVIKPEAKIVPLSLQILLENCVKHNIVSTQQPLVITIQERENFLYVVNNLQMKSSLKKSSGIGLLNIRERYQILSTRNIAINQSKSEFKVELPLLTKKSSIMKSTDSNINYTNARKRLEDLKGFYWNIMAYCFVIPFLITINYLTSWNEHKWFVYPMFGWGIGIAFQAYHVFGKDKYFGKAWENRKMQEFMEEEESKANRWE
jgi:hypothetical protein